VNIAKKKIIHTTTPISEMLHLILMIAPHCDIDRLNGELEESKDITGLAERRTYTYGEECKKLTIDLEEANENHAFYKSSCKDLQCQLAEVKAELQTLVVGTNNDISEARQEAAKECLEVINFGINAQPLMKGEVFAKWINRNIKAKYRLDG